MRTTGRQLTRVLMAVGGLFLTLATATPTLGKSGHALMVRAVTVRGSEVAITVANLTAKAQAGTVTYRFLTSRGEVAVTAPIAAAAGQTVTIKTAVPELILYEFPMGVVVDDGAPF
jgi:hypothetical protein